MGVNTSSKLVIEKEIGYGSFASVFQGKLGERKVAIKKINKERLARFNFDKESVEKTIASFRKEAEMLKSVRHPNIVAFYEIYEGGTHGENTILVMELMVQNLRTYLEANKGQITMAKQVDICLQTVTGLRHLHELRPHPILHRDLTPANILVDEMGDTFKISDLGQSKFRPTAEAYLTSDTPGHLLYMPPEAFKSKSLEFVIFSCKSDMFSFGVTMLQVATQCKPTSGLLGVGSKPEIVRREADIANLSDDHQFKPIILECLRDTPKDRPEAGEVHRQLRILHERFVVIHSELLLQGSVKVTKLCNTLQGTYNGQALLLDNKIYLYDDAASGKTLQFYNIEEHSWRMLPSAPQYDCQAAVIGGLLTLIGGKDTSNASYTNMFSSWTEEQWKSIYPAMMCKRFRPGVVSQDNLTVVTGGLVENKIELHSIEVFNSLTRQWSFVETLKLPKPLFYHKMATCSDCIYIYDDWDKKVWYMPWRTFKELLNPEMTPMHRSRLTSPSSHYWESAQEAPVKWSSLLPCSTHPLLVGGADKSLKPTALIYMYDSSRHIWMQVGELSEARSNVTVVPINNRAFIVLGGYHINCRQKVELYEF